MNISAEYSRLTPDRVTVLHLRSQTFEEERILSAIRDAITRGGSMEISVPGDDDEERVLNCSFRVMEADDEVDAGGK